MIVLCEYRGIRQFLIRACLLGMCDGSYIYVNTWLGVADVTDWQNGDQYDEIAKEAYKNVIFVGYFLCGNVVLHLCFFIVLTPSAILLLTFCLLWLLFTNIIMPLHLKRKLESIRLPRIFVNLAIRRQGLFTVTVATRGK